MTKVPPDREAERARWRRLPRSRPENVEPVGPGQESVWDYPRPPRVEPVGPTVRVELAGRVVARSDRALRVCETASPPTVYVPRADVDERGLEPSDARSFCEWKGVAHYWHVVVDGRRAENAAWSYPEPDAAYAVLRECLAFYPGRVECFLGDERVRPQAGAFYGGWITDAIRGPFKGDPGTEGW